MRYRKAVFIIAYTKIKNKIEYLLLKRKLHWRGWEFPKGGVEIAEREKKAVKRELLEETGLLPLKIRKFNFSGKYNYKKILLDRPGFIGQKFQLYSTEVKKSGIKIDKKEHNGFRWVNFEEAIKLLTWQNQKRSMKIVNGWLKRN